MRLIDADHLDGKMIPNCPIEEGGIPLPDFATHIKILEMYPTVDAVPVVHGEWVGTADGYADGELVYDMWECSECGYDADGADEKPDWNYCPNCGADMRERAVEGAGPYKEKNEMDRRRAWIKLQGRCPMRLIKENVKTGEISTICLAEPDGVETHATYWSCDMESCPGLEEFMEAAIMGVEE